MFTFERVPKPDEGPRHDRTVNASLAWLVIVCATLTVGVTARPYRGIVHDARLYFVQAAQQIDPSRFAGDLFLVHGSQDSYSLFSRMYAPLVEALGAPLASIAYVAVFGIVWMAAIVGLCRCMATNERSGNLAALAALLASSQYGAYQVFSFAEPFASPRLMAEALSIGGVVLIERRSGAHSIAVGAILLLAAAAAHPLMALPVICWMTVRHLRLRPLMFLATAASILVAVLASHGVDPFSRILQQFDAEWFSVVERRLQFALIDQWSPISWLPALLPLAGLAHAAVVAGGVRRALSRSLLVATLLLLTVALFASLGRNLLLVNLQLWRVLWVFGTVGTVCYALACFEVRTASAVRYALWIGMAISVMERLTQAPPLASGCVAICAVIGLLLERRSGSLGRAPDLTIAGITCLGLWLMLGLAWTVHAGDTVQSWLLPLGLDILSVTLASGLSLLQVRGRLQFVVAAFVLIISGIAVARWDRRNALHAYLEGEPKKDPALAALFAGRTVYWEDGVETLWMQYQMPSYYSCLQGAGAMFFRATATEYNRRGTTLEKLGGGGFEQALGASCEPLRAEGRLQDVVQTSPTSACQSLPDLDLLVLPRRYDGVVPAAGITVKMSRRRAGKKVFFGPDHVYVYACSSIRQ